MAHGISLVQREIQPAGWRSVAAVRTYEEFEAIKRLVDRVYAQRNSGKTVQGTLVRLGDNGEEVLRHTRKKAWRKRMKNLRRAQLHRERLLGTKRP